jgi:hypothetical protein
MHTDKDMEQVLAAGDEVFAIIRKGLDSNSIAALLKCPERQIGFRRLV